MNKNCLNIIFYFHMVFFCLFMPILGYSQSGFLPVCQRTPEVILAILAETGKEHCTDVTRGDVNSIKSLRLEFYGLHKLKDEDFSNMIGLEVLMLNINNLVEMPVINDSPFLEALYLNNNNFTDLPENLAPVISRLRILDISYNQFTTLPDVVARNIKNFEEINFKGNPLDLSIVRSEKFLSYDVDLQMVIWQSVPGIDKISIITDWLLEHLQYHSSQLVNFFLHLSEVEEKFILQIPILNVLSMINSDDNILRNIPLWETLKHFETTYPVTKETIEELPHQYLSYLGILIHQLSLSDRREISSDLHTRVFYNINNPEEAYLKIASSLIEDGDAQTSANVAKALGYIRTAESIQLLQRLWEKNPAAPVSVNVAEALGRIRTAESTQLLQRLWEESSDIHEEAAGLEEETQFKSSIGKALVSQNTPEAFTFLRRIVADAPVEVRRKIASRIPKGIRKISLSTSEGIGKYYIIAEVMSRDEDLEVRTYIAEALGLIPVPLSTQLLQRLWEKNSHLHEETANLEEEIQFRITIGESLILQGTPEAFTFLRTIIVNAPVGIRREIADWIPVGVEKNTSDESIKGYYEIAEVMSRDEDLEVRRYIADALGKMSPAFESTQLLQRLWEEYPVTQKGVLELLREIWFRRIIGRSLILQGTPEAFTFLRRIVADAPVEVRREIANKIPMGVKRNSSDESIKGYYEIAHILSKDTDEQVSALISKAKKILARKMGSLQHL